MIRVLLQKPHPKFLNQATSSIHGLDETVLQLQPDVQMHTQTGGAVHSECKCPLLLNSHYANEPLKSRVITQMNMHQWPGEGDL